MDAHEFYSTPEWVTEALLRLVRFSGEVVEPCCGDGAISRVLLRHGYAVESSDVADRGYGRVQDFLLCGRYADNIVTNPPFSNSHFIRQALLLSRRKTALLLPTRWLERRWAAPLFGRGLRLVLPLTVRPKFGGGRAKPSGHPAPFELAWFVWERGYRGRAEMEWV